MMFVFASMGNQPNNWTEHVMYATEASFVLVAFACLFLGRQLSETVPYQVIATMGGIGDGFGLVMPFELAPYFFGVRGEWMMATIGLILAYPIVVPFFIRMYHDALRP